MACTPSSSSCVRLLSSLVASCSWLVRASVVVRSGVVCFHSMGDALPTQLYLKQGDRCSRSSSTFELLSSLGYLVIGDGVGMVKNQFVEPPPTMASYSLRNNVSKPFCGSCVTKSTNCFQQNYFVGAGSYHKMVCKYTFCGLLRRVPQNVFSLNFFVGARNCDKMLSVYTFL